MLMLILLRFLKTTHIVIFKNQANHDRNKYSMAQSQVFHELSVNDQIDSYLLNGFVGNLTDETVKKLEHNKNVALVEQDQKISVKYKINDVKMNEHRLFSKRTVESDQDDKLTLTLQTNAPWGISRISSGTNVNKSSIFRYPLSSADDVTIYVLDTGIFTEHDEFEGRATFGANFTRSESDTDENGHGTHCAGVIGGSTVGIAKKSHLVSVKVLEKDGNGMLSSLIMGIDYVIRQHSEKMEDLNRKGNWFDEFFDEFSTKKTSILSEIMNMTLPMGFSNLQSHLISNLNSNISAISFSNERSAKFAKKLQREKPKSIVNMSVGGLKSNVLDYALKFATDMGIHFSVAAGNDHENACRYSPSSNKMVLTAGASTKRDTIAFFSNYGECVDLFAPGVEIESAWIDHKYRVVSGTSMAAPHVTGSMALYLGERDYSPIQLIEMVKKDSYRVIKQPGMEEKEFYMVSIRKLLREIHEQEIERKAGIK